MTADRNYNRMHRLGRFGIQIMLDQGTSGFLVTLTPRASFAANNHMAVVAVGIDWLWGTLNLAFLSKHGILCEEQRARRNAEQADRLGITARQQALRYGW